jgi:uncharacterized membrane protein
LTGLSAQGLALSSYLSWHYLKGGSVIGCGGGNPCDEVLDSRWSTVAGVLPVSGLAAGAYMAMLTASLFVGVDTEGPVRRLAWRAMTVLAGAAAGSAVWFIIVQKWFVRAFCPYCMATHITSLLLAALVIWRARKPLDGDSTGVALANPARATLVGVMLAAILAVCQVGLASRAVDGVGASRQDELPVDPHSVPLVGSPDARYVVTLLFDYKCPHCQELHFMLDEAIRRSAGKLAFALCPAPLSRQCNPYIPRDVDEFADSCELAKVGLAVWVAKREAFPAFDRWMFSLESGDRWRPRTLEAANAKAVELVGQSRFDAARSDPWIDRYLQSCIRIYGNAGGHAVPKLVFGSRWVTPQPNDADDLILILRNSLAVPKP